jgi:hypothetical protein
MFLKLEMRITHFQCIIVFNLLRCSVFAFVPLSSNKYLMIVYLFQAHMKFPNDYPYSPPSIRFLTKVWHPNVYEVRFINLLLLNAVGN